MKKKKTGIVWKIVFFLFLTSTIASLLRSFVQAVVKREWNLLLLLFFLLMLIVLSAFRWIKSLISVREEYRQRFFGQEVRLRDALLYGLSFSRDIYRTIPPERKKLVKYAFILIGLPFLIIAWDSRMAHFSLYLLNLLLVLAGVNILLWIMASEREEKERLKIELETARQMQLSLMPAHSPKVVGLDIAGACIPARSVGGDHYDFVWLGKEKDRLGVAVVDVSGKGVDAALTAVYTSGAFVSEIQHESEAARVMGNLNLALRSRRDPRHFVSFFFMVIDPLSRHLQYVNAGQSRPLLYREGRISLLMGEGPRFPLGIRSMVDYLPCQMELKTGDCLLLYTDGVPDAMDADDRVFGIDRLQDTFRSAAESGASAEGMVAAVRSAEEYFARDQEPYDDITLVAMRVM